MQPHNVVVDTASSAIFRGEHLSAYATRVIHGSVPALAWRVEIGGKSIVFSGDTNGEGAGLVQLAKDADLFIAHNAVPEGATGIERRLHMPPSVIGQIAQEAHVKRLVLSHRMLRTLGREEQSQSEIRKTYSGPVACKRSRLLSCTVKCRSLIHEDSEPAKYRELHWHTADEWA